MFIDKATIQIKAGDGGNGCISFRREKYVPRGGPSGGDGGNGGNIVFIADKNTTTLLDFKYQPLFNAKRGESGKGKQQHGKDGEDVIIKIPLGTIVREEDGTVIHDFVMDKEAVVVARGGRGGRGNVHFKSSTERAPRIAEEGKPGEEKKICLELKVIADVGLVGYPNAGKSTLISHISNATPKVAPYPFTTLAPHLGVVKVSEYRTIVLADIPGLIKGAHKNIGLGHEFLKHIERTTILLFVIDMGATEGRDPYQDYCSLKEELRLYNENLMHKTILIAANKMDIPEAEENLKRFCKKLKILKKSVVPLSAITGFGLKGLVQKLAYLTEQEKKGTPGL